jgi:hypothetical protein
VMLAGPKQAISGPNEPPPVGPGHRGQLARLIRERPVFVNVAGCRIPDPSKRRNLREYIGFRGVFQNEDGGSPPRALDPEPADIIEDISDP